jgi:UDP-glucose 4-epimerase
VVDIFRQQFLKDEPLTVRLPGTQRRIFTHVNDIVDGLLLVGEKGEGDEFGLGADNQYSVLEIAKMFGSEIITFPERGGNRMTAKIDTTKSHSIGWRAKHDVSGYIKEIVENKRENTIIEKTPYPTEI